MPKASTGRFALISYALTSLSIATACAAFLSAGLLCALPRLSVTKLTLRSARSFKIPPRLRADFDYLAGDPTCRGQRMGAVLDHVELADLQRRQFYERLDDSVFRNYVLSYEIAPLPLAELDWRRSLWEHFYPRVRREKAPFAGAQIVVRCLQERISIMPGSRSPVGPETIWIQQMTDKEGFERIYVAALRSVGIAARLNPQQQAEQWTGEEWKAAPRPLPSFL